ncbi:MAG TPA: LysR family transcriptional regulator [candidate division Zixibacteria bacterium]|nr:LysR family transcriptional regulator [candidate division Zixibacteria bacterium]
MTLHQLEIFVAVARHLNLRKASEELHISEPSVSQQLKLLEEDLKAKLYVKAGRGIELTEEGQRCLSAAESVVRQVSELRRSFHSKSIESDLRPLKVGGSHGPSIWCLPSILAAFRRKHPTVLPTLRTDVSHEIEKMVLNSDLDIALITAPSGVDSLVYMPFRREEYVIVASAGHPVAKKGRFTLADLNRAAFVIRRRIKGRMTRTEELLRDIEKRGIKVNIAMYCDTSEAVKGAVKNGAGLGIVHRDMVRPEIKRGELKVIKVRELEGLIKSYIVYRKDRPLSPDAQAFLDFLRQRASKQPVH